MRLPILPFFALLLALGATVEDDEEEEYDGGYEEGDVGDVGKGDEDEAPPQAVYVMEHGFLSGELPKWTPRGTLLLSGAPGRGYEARLSDAKEFVQLRPELQPLMTEAAGKNRYYAIRMYSPEKPKRVLQASIPANLLADHFEDWHDILEVTIGSTGAPVSLSYRVRNTLGLALFDHTQVHIAEPSRSEGPRTNPSARVAAGGGGAGGGKVGEGGEQPATSTSFLRKYWWVIIIVLLLLSSGAGDDGSSGKQASGGGGGGGGGRRSSS
jgi:hypothetical protein